MLSVLKNGAASGFRRNFPVPIEHSGHPFFSFCGGNCRVGLEDTLFFYSRDSGRSDLYFHPFSLLLFPPSILSNPSFPRFPLPLPSKIDAGRPAPSRIGESRVGGANAFFFPSFLFLRRRHRTVRSLPFLFAECSIRFPEKGGIPSLCCV